MKSPLRTTSSLALPASSGVAEMEQWLTHRTFWFVALVVAVVLVPFTAAWIAKQAWVIAGVTGSGLLAIVLCGWRVRKNPKANVNAYIWAILIVEFLAMATVAWLQGGSQAPALRWQAIIPCIAIAAGAYRIGLGMTVFFVVQVLVMHVYQPDYLPAFRAHVLPSPGSQGLLAVIIPVCLFAFFGWFTTKWRSRVLDALEQARREARQGEEAKERFLATISHEIRTPLNGVVGTLSLLRAGHLPPAQQQQLFDLMTHSSRSLLSMLNDVLDWSKLDAGHMQAQRHEVDLRDLLEDCVDLFAVQASEKGLEITCSHGPEVPTLVLSDGPRLRQIVHNLLGNAVKFTAHGSIHLHLSCQAKADQDAVLALSVRDSGIGMDDSQRARLFQPFVQADQSITRQYGGTGLGLAISRELARLLGGDIEVASQPGQGSNFSLKWTTSLAPVVAEADPPPLQAPLLLLTDQDDLALHIQSCAADLDLAVQRAQAVLVKGQPVPASWRDAIWLVDGRVPFDAGWLDAIGHRPAMLLVDVVPQGPDRWPAIWMRRHKPIKRSLLRQDLLVLSGAIEPVMPDSAASQPVWRALVADDNATNQLILGEMLELLGLSVQMASTGQQAVAHWQEHALDVLLIDYQMPGMDGLSAVAQIRNEEREKGLPRLPIVLVSGDATLRSAEEWRQHGIDHVLSKPIEFADLSRLVELMQQTRP